MWTTPDLCDAHAEEIDVVTGIGWQHFGAVRRFGGPAATVRCFEDNSRVKEALAEPGKGQVLVVDGGGSVRHALIGDMIAARAAEMGWAGVIIHGACRDVEVLAGIEIGIMALGSVPVRSVRRGEGQFGIVVSLGGVRFYPGDHVYADENGIIRASRALV
ncbi:ribonuclease E activity regulator RraA [Wenzhouxiangella sp. AB-CW3]|uniref:ribonuclease E activity regulator RraA n=1 Tax=Wenzhouxiangella sp. AB-CW3 TaxID=2771012 RepID=UPI00168BCE61|nr:ribonuclease E activity regulator RraA [Wenzhouxiangella sp. AB-CW3]QOC21954.1 ribonuclease E activity regulator RraA [Wenzhouxiangella sp. AB-CW3]